jgi:hypothetical protein
MMPSAYRGRRLLYRISPPPARHKKQKNLTAALTSGKNYPENIASEKFYPFLLNRWTFYE